MSKKQSVTHYSWTILSSTEANKVCDKSVFEYNSSGIPKNVRAFFGVNNLKQRESIRITLIKGVKSFDARITNDPNNRTKISWNKDLAKELQMYKDIPNVILSFHKLDNKHYEICIQNKEQMFDSIAPELENIVVITNVKDRKEGKKIAYYTTKYERNPKNRVDAIRIHGVTCQACGFDFVKEYGELGKDYIEVHHRKPLFSLTEEIKINPETDLVCVCANCHRMLHRQRNRVLEIEELKYYIQQAKQSIRPQQ